MKGLVMKIKEVDVIINKDSGIFASKTQLYYCNECKSYGFPSTHTTKEGKSQCTNCANKMRFGI